MQWHSTQQYKQTTDTFNNMGVLQKYKLKTIKKKTTYCVVPFV